MMYTRNIKQSLTFRASPHAVYEALTDSRKHSKFTGVSASISRRVGGKFTVADGHTNGINLVLIPDRKILQAWRISMKGWSKDHYSLADFSLKRISGGTRLNFTQLGVPSSCYQLIKHGWHEHYWTKMKNFLVQTHHSRKGARK